MNDWKRSKVSKRKLTLRKSSFINIVFGSRTQFSFVIAYSSTVIEMQITTFERNVSLLSASGWN